MSLRKFYKQLETYRVGEHYDRRPYCYLEVEHDDKLHKFEVRHWKMESYSIRISAVNWTIAAGPCSIVLNGYNYKKFTIVGE